MFYSIKRRIKSYLISRFNLNQQNAQSEIHAEFPVDFTEEEKEIIRKVKQYTMTSNERMVALARAVDYIEMNNIQGEIVECGVWRGGSMMLTAYKLMEHKNTNRNLFLFDTFEGMTEPSDFDRLSSNNKDAQSLYEETKYTPLSGWCMASLEEVKKNLESTNYPQTNIHFIKGKVEETLPHNEIKKISILRLDTDWYESTKCELEILFDKLEPGGVLIIDDYGHWTGAKKAVDEFFKQNKITMFLNRIDYTGRLGIKR